MKCTPRDKTMRARQKAESDPKTDTSWAKYRAGEYAKRVQAEKKRKTEKTKSD